MRAIHSSWGKASRTSATRVRRAIVLLIGLATTSCTTLGANDAGPESRDSKPRRPNILVIVADDLGWFDVGYHGSSIETPEIDSLVREGVELDRFYASPICSTTRAALMSGRSPIHFGGLYAISNMPEHEYTIAERFRDAGYRTTLVGKWHLGKKEARHPNAQGFSSFYGFLLGMIDYYTHMNLVEGRLDWQRDGRDLTEKGYSTHLLGAEAVRTIVDRDPDQPFFLVLSFNAPHYPKQAPKRSRLKYRKRPPCAQDKMRCIHAAQVDVMDHQIGRVLRALESEGIADDTIVLFLSDNGGQTRFGGRNFPLRGEKGTAFEGGIRVPAVIRWTGTLSGNRRSMQYMRDFDVYPTLEAAAGLPILAPSEGSNLWPVLMGDSERTREPFLFAVDVFANPEDRGNVQRAVIDRGLKLLVREFQNESGISEWDYSLFDLENDPSETVDIAAQHPEKVLRLVQSIENWERLHPSGGARLFTVKPSTIAPLAEQLVGSSGHGNGQP